MSGSTQPLPEGGGTPYQQPPAGGWPPVPPASVGPAGAWETWGAAPPAAPAPRRRATGPVLLALAGAAVGAAVAALVVSAVFLAGAREMAQEAGTAVGESIATAMSKGGDIYSWGYEDEAGGVLGTYDMPPVEQFPAVAPGALGPDPVLDAYAQSCFAGDLQACDDLFYESPPMSGYEEYGTTCAGRVKQYAVEYCTDLD